MPPRVAAILGSVLIILVGLARGFGGVVLLSSIRMVLPGTSATPDQMSVLGAGLLVVAALSICSGILILLHRSRGVAVGLIAMALFVLGGIANGTVLYGAPKAVGLVGNVLIAAVVCILLLRARKSLIAKVKN